VVAIENRSGLPAQLLSLPDADAQEVQVLIVSATFYELQTHEWQTLPEQPPVCLADEYFGEPSPTGSLRNEAQIATAKHRIDVLINGTAYSPHGAAVSNLIVALHVGTIAKQVRVVGDRYRSVTGVSSPQYFDTMPVIFERAYGGFASSGEAWGMNPSGFGFRDAPPARQDITSEYPNLEPVTGRLEGPPAGFGIIGRGWSPRLEYAGTFDSEWLADQWPLWPRDFDTRHFQSAPADQQLDSLRTGEFVRLLNFTPEGIWQFAMPSTYLPVMLVSKDGAKRAWPRMDTVLIEPDKRQIRLIFRLTLAGGHGSRLREIVIQPLLENALV
jgi:hypothetical protein